MISPIFGGLATVSVQSAEGALLFHGFVSDGAKFTVVGLPHVVIFDNRPNVREALEIAQQNGQFKAVYKYLNAPAMIEAEKEDGEIRIYIDSADEDIRVSDTPYRLWVDVETRRDFPAQSLLSVSGPANKPTSFVHLFRVMK